MCRYIVCDLRFCQLSPHNRRMHIITLSKYMTNRTACWLKVVLYFSGEEHGGTSDKLTGFHFCLILCFILSPPSNDTLAFPHTHTHTHTRTHPTTSHHALQQTVTAVAAGHSGEDGLDPLNTPSALALFNHAQEGTAHSPTHTDTYSECTYSQTGSPAIIKHLLQNNDTMIQQLHAENKIVCNRIDN